MTKLIKAMCPDSEIAAQIKCERRKATALVKNVTGQEDMSRLAEQLLVINFPLLLMSLLIKVVLNICV